MNCLRSGSDSVCTDPANHSAKKMLPCILVLDREYVRGVGNNAAFSLPSQNCIRHMCSLAKWLSVSQDSGSHPAVVVGGEWLSAMDTHKTKQCVLRNVPGSKSIDCMDSAATLDSMICTGLFLGRCIDASDAHMYWALGCHGVHWFLWSPLVHGSKWRYSFYWINDFLRYGCLWLFVLLNIFIAKGCTWRAELCDIVC